MPKRMKKLGRAFYDRMSTYEAALNEGQPALAAEIARRLSVAPDVIERFARSCIAVERELSTYDLARLVAGPFPARPARAEAAP